MLSKLKRFCSFSASETPALLCSRPWYSHWTERAVDRRDWMLSKLKRLTVNLFSIGHPHGSGQVEIYSAAALLNQGRRREKGSHGWPSALPTHTGAVRTPRPGRQRRFLATRSCHRTCSRREGSQKKIQLKLGTPPVEQPDIPHWTLWLTPTMHVTQLMAAAAPSAIRPLPPATPVVRRAGSSLVSACVTTLRSTLTGLCRELRLVAMPDTDRPQCDDCCRGHHTQPWHGLVGPRRGSFRRQTLPVASTRCPTQFWAG